MISLYTAPLLVLILFPFTQAQSQSAPAANQVPTIAFCEMVKHPKLYFDKPVRITAKLELATEGSYLRSDECVLTHDQQIGAGYTQVGEAESDARNRQLDELRTDEYAGRARVTVVGILRNVSLRAFSWYQYRFDIIHIENLSHVVRPYEGSLEAGSTYRASVRGNKVFGLSLAVPLRLPEHEAVRIEWTNLNKFRGLRSNGHEQTIVFSVVSDKIKQIADVRWNRTIRCKIIRVD